MDPVQARAVADFLLADFENEIPTTLRVLEAVPTSRLDYQPDPKSKTALGLLRHIALEDEWLLTGIANGVFVPPPDDSDSCGIMTPADASARYQANVPPALQRVRALPPEKLTAILDLMGVFQVPTLSLLATAAKHSIHHRGQLSTYIRAMGGKVPGIYGPSADTL